MTDAERSIWRILGSTQMDGHRFRRQVPFGQYIAPSLTLPRSRGREGWGCYDARLIVEIDGGQHERSSPDEAKRTRFLEDQGYRILRFWKQ
jgi:very-short-patch-repair endonuclease